MSKDPGSKGLDGQYPFRKEAAAIPMPDGISLAADLYLPADTGATKWPVALAMTPYGKAGLAPMMAKSLCPHGYAVVVVDVRGRYDSPGTFEPVAQERRDAPAVVDWIANQPWFDAAAGIGTLGLSYLATAGFLAAAASPLVKAATCITVVLDQNGSFYRNGVLDLHHAFPWSLMTSYSPQPDLKRWDWGAVFRHLPLATMDQATGVAVPTWQKLIVDAAGDEGLQAAMSIRKELRECRAPVLHLAGWYDFILGESLEAYRILTEAGHAPQALYIGPWTHTSIMTGETKVGEHDYGPAASSRLVDRIRQWFDHWLKGGAAALEGVNVFVTGRDPGWRRLNAWPDPAGRDLRLHLAPPDGSSLELARAAAAGEPQCAIGSLAAKADGATAQSLSYTYDPVDPTPTLGGSVWPFALAGLVPGPADQRPLLTRRDGLVFIGQELSHPVTVVGPIRLHLEATTDCPDTDFAARVFDITPDGTWRIVQDGIQRARFRDGARPGGALLEAGEEFAVEIDLWAAGHSFGEGHRIGLHIAGSNFPKYARNLNTGGDPLWEDAPRPARHQIRLGSSYLVLTTLEEGGRPAGAHA